MRNFLLVNDDGFDSEGLRALADALGGLGKIYICAPDTQQSGMSHSITLATSFEIVELEYPGAEKAWRVSGTPADCTKVGLQFCRELGVAIDVVYSGINKGSNLGTDTLYSGTVGAAMEASLAGIRAVAVSVNDHNASHFETAAELVRQTLDRVLSDLAPNTVLNINTPNLPPEEVRGLGVEGSRTRTLAEVGGTFGELEGRGSVSVFQTEEKVPAFVGWDLGKTLGRALEGRPGWLRWDIPGEWASLDPVQPSQSSVSDCYLI